MKVTCHNNECVESHRDFEINWNGQSSVQLYDLLKCPICGQVRKIIEGSVEKTSPDFSSIGVGKIAGMTPFERKQILKQRSNEHFKTEIKTKKEYLDRVALRQEK